MMGVCCRGAASVLLFCPLERLCWPMQPFLIQLAELGRSQGEKCHSCAVILFDPSPSSASSVSQAVVLSVCVSPAWNSPRDESTSLNPLTGRCFCRTSFPCSPQECSSLSPSGLQQTLKFQALAALLAEMRLFSPA